MRGRLWFRLWLPLQLPEKLHQFDALLVARAITPSEPPRHGGLVDAEPIGNGLLGLAETEKLFNQGAPVKQGPPPTR